MAKDVKMKRFTIRRACSRETECGPPTAANTRETKGLRIQSHRRLFGEIKGVAHRSPQSSQKKPKIEPDDLGKLFGGASGLTKGRISVTHTADPQVSRGR